jgi:hypothetical protein
MERALKCHPTGHSRFSFNHECSRSHRAVVTASQYQGSACGETCSAVSIQARATNAVTAAQHSAGKAEFL